MKNPSVAVRFFVSLKNDRLGYVRRSKSTELQSRGMSYVRRTKQ